MGVRPKSARSKRVLNAPRPADRERAHGPRRSHTTRSPLTSTAAGSGDPDDVTRKDLVDGIRRIIRRRRLAQKTVAELLGIQQPKVSTLLRGPATEFSTARLLRFLTSLSKDVEIVVKAKSPSRARGVVQVQEVPVATTHVTLANATDI